MQDSLGFSPFKLIFGRTVRGPLKLVKEAWLGEDTTVNLLDHMSDCVEEKLSDVNYVIRTPDRCWQ